MQVNGVPNKYEIYQDYYLLVNGKEISYTEALKLFSKMNNEERTDFEQYYKDETGYEIIDANGTSYGENIVITDTGKTKKVKSKKKTADGSFGGWEEKEVKIYTSNSKKVYIDMKYTIEGYAKEKGIVLDSVWSQYSAEEIMRMKNNGVNIPQDIVDIASTIIETSAVNYETNGEEETTTSNETTEKEPFLELIPKAEKKIDKCNENNEKINAEIEAILPEKQKHERDLADKMKAQRNSLEEYERQIREWRTLQNKVNNGETLSDIEARRYAKITGMLEDKNKNSDDFQIDKKEIAKSLNQINILALLGEKLSEETIEIGETLADYTSKTNYKRTKKNITQEIGIIRSIIAMANGKNLAKEATRVGNNTKDYSEETTNSVNDIASILGIESSIADSNTQDQQKTPEIKAAEQSADETKTNSEAQENIPATNDEQEQANAAEQTNDTQQEDFIITDDNVKNLINESGEITSDLLNQFKNAKQDSKTAKRDKKIAIIADKKIAKLVKEYQEEEARRQDAIKTKEEENNQAKKELEKLTGKSSEEIDQELNSNNSNNNYDENMDEQSKNEVQKHKQTIANNNKEIANLNSDKEQAIQNFKNKTQKEQSFLDKSIPEDSEALENNSKYLEETLPQNKERLNFTESSGKTLTKMGKFRVSIGMDQIANLQIKKGIRNVSKGTVSMGIGLAANMIANTPIPKLTEKATNIAVGEGNEAVSSLTSLNDKIVSVTGEGTTTTTTTTNSEANQQGGEENSNNPQSRAAAENTTANTQETADNTELTTVTTNETSTPANQNINDTAEPKDSSNISTKEINKSLDENNTKATKTPNEQNSKELNSTPSTPTKSSSSEKEDDEMSTDDAQDNVDDVKGSAKDDSKESERVKKDTDKTTKELEKETKQLTKLMKKDEKEIIKMTKESTEAAKKQEEALAEYETLVAENEQLIAEDEQNQANQAPAQIAPQQNTNEENQTTLLGSAAMTIGGAQNSNTDKIANNDQRINELGISFNTNGRIIERNRTKITSIQKTTKTRQKKFNKKIDIIEQKNKETQEKELEKQKRLQKQLGAVGIAENVFQITLSTGQIMCMVVLPPWIPAAGAVMVTIGQYGVLSCGLTKGVINIANGNLTAGLMAIGQSAISLATSMTGTGAAAGGVLGAVSAGLNVVSSSASLVNNVRAVQGKEASGVFSKISTIAGVGSSLTSSAATLSNLGKSTASTFGKSMQIAGVAGSALSSASQLMTEFGGDSKVANILGMVGGAVSTVSALGMLADKKFSNASDKNKENKEKTEQLQNQPEENQNNTKQTNETETKTNTDAEIEKELNNTTPETIQETQNETANPPAPVEEKPTKFTDLIETDVTVLNEDAKVKMAELSGQISQQQQQIVEKQIRKENRKEILSNATNALAGAANVAGSLFTKSDDQQQQQKKKAPAGKLTERTKEIMRKNKKRIAALAAKGYNI